MPTIIESLTKSLYKEFKATPCDHSHKAFVRMCVSRLGRPEEVIKHNLESYEWYIPNE